MWVSLQGTSGKLVDLERLKDEDEVWMLCLRKPKPGWRLFGRFWAQDRFIALRAYDRNVLNGRKNFAGPIQAFIADWNNLVGLPFVNADDISAYLTGSNWRDVDEEVD